MGSGLSQVEYTRQQVLSGYIFLDWFAIPQITARAEGVNEESTKSDAALAVQSIPFYVETSNIFLALVPEVKHCTTGKFCNYASWLSRGHQVDTAGMRARVASCEANSCSHLGSSENSGENCKIPWRILFSILTYYLMAIWEYTALSGKN